MLEKKHVYCMCVYIYSICIYFWISYHISLTWNKVIWGWFPLLIIVPGFGRNVRSLNFYPDMYVCIIYIYIHYLFIYLLSYFFYILSICICIYTPYSWWFLFPWPKFPTKPGPTRTASSFSVRRSARNKGNVASQTLRIYGSIATGWGPSSWTLSWCK